MHPKADAAVRSECSGRPTTVLFACVQNAGRSQIAAAWFEARGRRTGLTAVSAGCRPAAHVHPEVVTVMREVDIDLTLATPRRLDDELASAADVLVTMGCGECVDIRAGGLREDWSVEDPHGKPLDDVRRIRDDIRKRVERLITSLARAP